MFARLFFLPLILLTGLSSWGQSLRFNPDAPIYIEYHTHEASPESDISVQIEDAQSNAKIRLSLQSKPQSEKTYYGYIWLQIGKPVTNEVFFRKVQQSKKTDLKGWLTEQEGLQTLFLFDQDDDLAQFKKSAENSKKPLADKNNLPVLANSPAPLKEAIIHHELGEAARYGRLMEAYSQFTPEQQKMNNQRAEQLAVSALRLYQQKKYAAAENQLTQSLKLNPTSLNNKYYLALCYYQTKKYDRSQALLSLAEGADYNYAEYKYYSGLNQLKLKNYAKALEELSDAQDENDPDYSGAAAFFSGHIQYQKENYQQARQNFDYTIDHSKNVKMDREAEAMIEKIDQIENLKNQMKERFNYSLFAGFGYDSNVLNISSENLTTNLAAYRLMYGASLKYKFFYNLVDDLSIDFNLSDSYSLNDKFKSDSTVQSADPLQLSVGLPYHRRFQVGSRFYTWGFLPSYQTLNMSLEDSTRKKILDSTVIASDLQFAFTDRLYSKFYLEYSMDHSSLTVTSPENDLTAQKISFLTTQTYTIDSLEKKNALLDLGYVLNNANGDNNDYTKLLAALTYAQLGFWSATPSFKIDYANTKYSHALTARTDSVTSLTAGLNKDLTKKINLGLSGQYTLSSSNVDTYTYNKFSVQSVVTYSGAF